MAESWRRPASRSVSSCSSGSMPSPNLLNVTPLTTRRCRTCHRFLHTSGNIIGECLLICISTHQTKSKWIKMKEDLPEPVLIPTQVQERTLFFDDIWFDFQELKDINEIHRQQISSTTKDRGALKTQAPLPWLLYRRRDGKDGQTRNQENYNQIWESCINNDDGLGPPIRFLTIKKSDLAENARRSRLSNDDTRLENLFTPSRTSSTTSSVCESPVTPQAELAFSLSFGDGALSSENSPTRERLCPWMARNDWRVPPLTLAERELGKDSAVKPRIKLLDSRGSWEDEVVADPGWATN